VQEPVDALDSRDLEAILQLRLVKYADPEYYQSVPRRTAQRSTKVQCNHWKKENDFDSYEPKRHFTEEQEWVRQDDDSLY